MNSRDIIRSLMTNSESVIYFKASDGRFTLVNQKWADQYGLEPHEIIGREHFDGYSPEIAEKERKEELLAETQNEARTTEEVVAADDGLHHHLTTKFPVHNGEGEVIGCGSISTEITDRKRLEQDLQYSQSELQKMVLYDQLTGAYSRHVFYEKVEVEVMRHRRYHHPASFLLIDLDEFKELNQRFGYQAGDETLVAVVKRIESVLRDTDAICRLEGAGFAVVAPETDIGGAERLAQRIVDAVRGEEFPVVQMVTVSIGVVRLVEGDELDLVLRRADEALLEAKSEGRNAILIKDV